jgi:hypothetical protein
MRHITTRQDGYPLRNYATFFPQVVEDISAFLAGAPLRTL